MKFSRICLAASLIAILAISAGCSSKKKETAGISTVKIDTARLAEQTVNLHFPGKVEASDEAELSFKVSGTISRIYVEVGQKVRAGQLLALLDTTDYRIQLDATQAEYDQVEADAKRVISLYEQKVTTKQNYDKAVYGLKQIKAKYENHKNQLSYCRLYAPVSGTIQDKTFEEGENVSAGMPILSMIGGGAPEVVIHIPAADYVRRESFESFDCEFDVLPGYRYALKPIAISPKANANQLYDFRLQVVPVDGPMPSPGMNTTVNIHCKSGAVKSLTVPTGGLFEEDGMSYVYVLSENVLEKRKVTPVQLLSDGSAVVVSDELNEGDAVVASGVHHVSEGEKVKPLKEASKTNIGGLL